MPDRDGRVEIEPAAEVRWLRDIYENSVAIITSPNRARSFGSSARWMWTFVRTKPLSV